MTRIEVRAHIGASSSRAADRVYEAQAAAYLDFTVASSTRLSGRDVAVRGTDEEESTTTRQVEGNVVLSPDVFIEDTQLGITVLQSQPFSIPATVIPATVRKRPLPATPDDQQIVPQTREVTSEEAPDSQSSYLKSPIFDRATKRRRTLDSPAALQGPHAGIARSRLLKPIGEFRISQSDDEPAVNAAEQDTSSQLPTTYSLSDITSDNKHSSSHRRAASDPGPHTSSTVTESPSSPTKARAQPVPVVSDPPPPPSTPKKRADDKLIMPPSPEPANEPFTTHVTSMLAVLKDEKIMKGVYNPVEVKRELQLLERGCWIFSIASLTIEAKEAFWKFLKDFIDAGHAGWHIMCSWSPDGTPEYPEPDTIMAFCWGELVEHTYLLLYVASKAAVRKLNPRWLDCRGDLVVTMPDLS